MPATARKHSYLDPRQTLLSSRGNGPCLPGGVDKTCRYSSKHGEESHANLVFDHIPQEELKLVAWEACRTLLNIEMPLHPTTILAYLRYIIAKGLCLFDGVPAVAAEFKATCRFASVELEVLESGAVDDGLDGRKLLHFCWLRGLLYPLTSVVQIHLRQDPICVISRIVMLILADGFDNVFRELYLSPAEEIEE